jgi:molybdate transport system substrate-binding protein
MTDGQPLREVIMLMLSRRIFSLGALASVFPQRSWAQTVEIRVICSGGFTAAYNILAPRFEQVTGRKVVSAYGASMGNAPDAIPQRLARGEPTDIIILARSALDEFAAKGAVRPDSRVDLAESRIGVAVRAGAPKPDIATVDGLRRSLLAASRSPIRRVPAGSTSRPSFTRNWGSRPR